MRRPDPIAHWRSDRQSPYIPRMQGIAFRKMQGLGNDFVVIDSRTKPVTLTARTAARIADRRWGVGADQVILIERASDADAHIRFWNPDGSEADACGNGSRCIAALLMQEARAGTTNIATKAGTLRGWDAGQGLVGIDMGPPRLEWQDIPLDGPQDTLAVNLKGLDGISPALPAPVAVSMGNPHAVFFVPSAKAWDLPTIGPLLEHDAAFPERANITLAEVVTPGHLQLHVWERSAGETLACGTAACADLVAAVRRGLTGRSARVSLPGGDLQIAWNEGDGHVHMIGPWAQTFEGVLSATLLEDAP